MQRLKKESNSNEFFPWNILMISVGGKLELQSMAIMLYSNNQTILQF